MSANGGFTLVDMNHGARQPQDPIFCENVALAMAYVPMQPWGNLYEPEVGFNRGTIFRDLDLPFIGEEALPRG
ncbi:spore coat associated protein CotJA [Zongyangia hominis]|uniref:Spore coat associated protein CotJA n=1 Tax=Zongyangia hominis TaxID=2763677 RepID=A0A926EDQ9_9FIRM|nr:spore coat associated protein CotJA [Zongyangia hominis]MBC8570041.1 spore coat associated protein CotJA [Zongyangia hominis]